MAESWESPAGIRSSHDHNPHNRVAAHTQRTALFGRVNVICAYVRLVTEVWFLCESIFGRAKDAERRDPR